MREEGTKDNRIEGNECVSHRITVTLSYACTYSTYRSVIGRVEGVHCSFGV